MDKILALVLVLILSTPAQAINAYSANTFGNSATDVVFIPNKSTIQVTETSAITFAVWINVTTFTGGRRIISKNAADGNGGPQITLDSTTPTELTFTFARSTTNAQAISSNSALVANTWYFVASIYDPNDTQPRTYLGTQSLLATERTYSGTPTNGAGTSASTASLTIGNASNATPPSQAFQGKIASAQMWTRRLSLPEIQYVQMCPSPLPPSNPVLIFLGYDNVATASTTTLIDQTGSGNNGTPFLSVGFTTAGNPLGPPFCPSSVPSGVGQ